MQHLHKPELFRLSWGAKNTRGSEWERLEAEFEERLLRMAKDAARAKTLPPQAVYAYLPANSDGDDLIVWDAEAYAATGEKRETARFSFPRQAGRRATLHQRLFRRTRERTNRSAGLADGHRRRRRQRRIRAAGGGKRIQRSLLLPWLGGASGRSHRQLPHKYRARSAGHRGGAGQTLQLGLSRLSRSWPITKSSCACCRSWRARWACR